MTTPAPPARTPEEWADHLIYEIVSCAEGYHADKPCRPSDHAHEYGAALLEEAARIADASFDPELIAQRIRSLAEKHGLALAQPSLAAAGPKGWMPRTVPAVECPQCDGLHVPALGGIRIGHPCPWRPPPAEGEKKEPLSVPEEGK